MPSFAIPKFTVLLKPLWVPAEFFLLSTGPNLDGTFFSARSCSRVFGFSILFDLPFLKIGIKRPSTFRIVRPVNGQFFDIRFLCLVRQTLARFVTLFVSLLRKGFYLLCALMLFGFSSTNLKLSLCQSILLAPDTELIQHLHQRLSALR